MPGRPNPPAWLVEKPGLTVLALLGGLIALFVLLPYLQFVLFGVVFAYIMFPVQQRAEQYVRPTIAAFVVVVATLLLVLIPLIYLLTIAVQQSLSVVTAVRNGQLDVASIEELLETAGYSVDLVALYESNQGRIATTVQELTSEAIDLVGGLPGLFIGPVVLGGAKLLFDCFAREHSGELTT